MALLGTSLGLLALFVGFGLLIGVLFGFFGMGGSFLVTPALIVLGYPSRVAVGSGLAFVFGTSVVGALRHRTLGQVDYRLAGLLTVSVMAGIEGGTALVLALEALGLADIVISAAYVLLLGTVGAFVTLDARREDDGAAGGGRGEGPGRLAALDLPLRVTLVDGTTVSVLVVLALGLVVGVLSGFLGVGGGFLLMPALLYGLGVPAAVAVGTDILQITLSGAYGTWVYARAGGVDLAIVAPLLAGSALGARVGSAATSLVDEDDIKGAFGAMLLLGSVAVGLKQVGLAYDVAALRLVAMALILGAALLVAGAVVYRSVRALRERPEAAASTAD